MTGVLVTAATTPLGAALVRALLTDARCEQVLAVGIEPDAHELLPLDDDRLHYVTTDLTRERHVRRVLFGVARERNVTAVVHTALHRSADDTGPRVHDLNVESTRTLLHLCERHPTIDRFVFRSHAEVYRHDHLHPNLIGEDQPLELGSEAPQRVRDRVEADLTVCSRVGMSDMRITVLRFAEVLAPASGSQLWDWLSSRVCLRPLGYNPIVNVLSIGDATRAAQLALGAGPERGGREEQGVFNIPGYDTLPVKRLLELWGVRDVPLPGPTLSSLYRLRRRLRGSEFRYDMNRGRLHTSDLLDGRRAERVLGYTPRCPIEWPNGPAA